MGDDDDAVRITRLDVIAGVNLAQPDAAGDRRDDAAIGQVQLLGVDLGLIGLHDRRLLLHRRRLGVEGLARDRVLCDERLVALQIDLGVFQRGLILRQLRLGLSQRDLVGPRVDLGEEIALVDHLAFLEGDLDELPVDLRLDGDHRERGHRAEPA